MSQIIMGIGLGVYNVGIKLIVYNEYRAIVEFEE